MKQRLFASLLFMGCVLVASQVVQAQCGGKAEPKRIEFKPGTHSSTLKGNLQGDDRAEYVFGANEKQSLTIDVATVPDDAISIELLTANGEAFQLQSNGTKWTGVLPETGDYLLFVKITDSATSRASYTLTLSIK